MVKCSHCQNESGYGIYSGDMPFLCYTCYNEFEKHWLEWIKLKFPPSGYMPMWYVHWHKREDRGKLCREWNGKKLNLNWRIA